MNEKRTFKAIDLAELAMFIAIVVVLASIPMVGYVKLGIIQGTTIHIPVILASILLGPKKGAIVGFVFGLTSLVSNTLSPGALSFAFSPFCQFVVDEANNIVVGGGFKSLIICFIPRMLIGVVPYYVFHGIRKLIKEKSNIVALIFAGLSGALTNTLLVMGSIYFLYKDTFAVAKQIELQAVGGVIMSIIFGNGIPEAILAAILTAGIGKVLLLNRRYKND